MVMINYKLVFLTSFLHAIIISTSNGMVVQSKAANNDSATDSEIIPPMNNQTKDTELFTPRTYFRYKISGGLTVTSFAMDFCRRISSCYKCVEKRCVFKGHEGGVDDGQYFCRHRRDVDENGGVEIMVTTKDECDVLTKRFGMKVLTTAVEPEENKELTNLEITGIITMTLTMVAVIILIVGGAIYVKRRFQPAPSSPFACQWRGSLVTPSYERFHPEKVDLMGIRR